MFELGYEVSCPSCLGKGEKVFNLLALVDTFLPVKYQQHPQSFGSLLAELTACSSRWSWSFFLATPSGVYSPKPPLLPLLIFFIVLCSLPLPILVEKAKTARSKVTAECLLHQSQKNR